MTTGHQRQLEQCVPCHPGGIEVDIAIGILPDNPCPLTSAKLRSQLHNYVRHVDADDQKGMGNAHPD